MIDIFFALDSLGRQFKRPGKHQRNRESDRGCQDDELNRPIRNLEKRKDLRRDLNQQPRHDRISNRDLVNMAPLQLPEEVLRIHGVAFATPSIYQQGQHYSKLRSLYEPRLTRRAILVAQPQLLRRFSSPKKLREFTLVFLRRVSGSGDHSEADQTLDRVGAAQE